MLKVLFATEIVPLSALVVVLALTEYASVPLPVPLAPLVTVIHGALLNEDHPHVAVTATVPVAPAAPTLTLLGEIVGEPQGPVSMNVFDTALDDDPFGPFATTIAS